MSKKNRHSKQKQDKQSVKPDNAIVRKRVIKSNGEPNTEVNVDKDDNLVLTPQDKARLDKVKNLQAKAKQANIDAKEAKAKAIEAIQALDGSDAIKAIKQDIEARLKAQEDVTSKALTAYQEAKDKLQSIQAEYKSLTGIDKASKASKGKGKGSNGSGKFETKIAQEADCLKVLVTHKASKSLFEYSLYPSNGTISKSDWLKLRAVFVGQFTKDTQEENLTLRAYLSNLKGKIESIKAISS